MHGAWSYRRLSLLILYSFYKNVTISMLGIWFAFYTGFSAQIYVDAISGSLYNMLFTAFPIMMAAVLNRDLSISSMIKHPELYQIGPKNEKFNIPLLMTYIAQARSAQQRTAAARHACTHSASRQHSSLRAAARSCLCPLLTFAPICAAVYRVCCTRSFCSSSPS